MTGAERGTGGLINQGFGISKLTIYAPGKVDHYSVGVSVATNVRRAGVKPILIAC